MMSSTSDSGIRSPSSSSSSCVSTSSRSSCIQPRILLPPRTIRTSSAFAPAASGEKKECTSSSVVVPRNVLKSGSSSRTPVAKDFILPKYANNRIVAKPGVRSSCLSLPTPDHQQDVRTREEKKIPVSNLPLRVIEGKIAKLSSSTSGSGSIKSEVSRRPVNQRTSARPQSLLLSTSSTSSSSSSSSASSHLTSSSFSLTSAPSSASSVALRNQRKGGIPVRTSAACAKEAVASVTSSIRSLSIEKKIGSIATQNKRQESSQIQEDVSSYVGSTIDLNLGRKVAQSIAKVTPFSPTRTERSDVDNSADSLGTNDVERSSGTKQQLSDDNNTAPQDMVAKESCNKESIVNPDSEADGKKYTQHSRRADGTRSWRDETDRRCESVQDGKSTHSMESLSLMIASYKVKLSERLDEEKRRKNHELMKNQGQTQASSFNDSYSDTESSSLPNPPSYCDPILSPVPPLRSCTLVPRPQASVSGPPSPCLPISLPLQHSARAVTIRREGHCMRGHSPSPSSSCCLMDQSDARHESQIRSLQSQLSSSRDRVCDLTSKLFAKTETLATLENTLSSMNKRLQQLALINHQKDMEINRMRAAAEVMQAYRMETGQKSESKLGTANDVLASPVRRLWLKSPFAKSFKGKILMSPKKTVSHSNSESDGSSNSCDSMRGAGQTSSSLTTVNDLTERIRKTDSILEKTRLEAISSAFHLENAKEVVKSMTEEIVQLRKQNQQLEIEETKRQSLLVTTNTFSSYLSTTST